MPSKNKGQTDEERAGLAGWPTRDASCSPLIINVPATVRHMRARENATSSLQWQKVIFSVEPHREQTNRWRDPFQHRSTRSFLHHYAVFLPADITFHKILFFSVVCKFRSTIILAEASNIFS